MLSFARRVRRLQLLIDDHHRASLRRRKSDFFARAEATKKLRTKIGRTTRIGLERIVFAILFYPLFEPTAVKCSQKRAFSNITKSAGNLNNRC
jgi:hypothetical protein